MGSLALSAAWVVSPSLRLQGEGAPILPRTPPDLKRRRTPLE